MTFGVVCPIVCDRAQGVLHANNKCDYHRAKPPRSENVSIRPRIESHIRHHMNRCIRLEVRTERHSEAIA